ncbi:hypothetical protein [Blastopirellula marina]|uniref:Large, multifunctional secreted protein n=1 Tax=Blastopirellula marina DSM 3645 TaxID=314230 RepID=A3ZWT5_9BACT|nr:hypothetical protein [Blastopirellula marina]EAQ79059.1 hypothetical protein DSM3645_13885 [Blastopirellula marina DSM 3645]
MPKIAFAMLLAATLVSSVSAQAPRSFSGVYPHLSFFNDDGECGTGAVVPWADRLWAITYSPHRPNGSTDKLYEIDRDLNLVVRPESVGGTPANRMIHRESNQLFIGPYAINAERQVRVIPPTEMYGRLTGVARHLTDPAGKLYFATMEEGFYEVDVQTLAVTQLYQDGNRQNEKGGSLLPGYHGKGLYSGQGRLVYANNGENSALARSRPDVDSGCLAEWDGDNWQVVRRNQFTEVTGPGGIYGSSDPAKDPLWSVGWDNRSLILMVLDEGRWHAYRLPKGSHCYDGAHGWNTEWPRIRDIGQDDLLMTMHGMFWRFPPNFSAKSSAGIAARSNYLKVIGDFCPWNNQVVFGCDDTAKAEFLNKRKAKGNLIGPGQSQSNLWFVDAAKIDQLGAPIARGAVWLHDSTPADAPSDPMLAGGFARRGVHLTHAEKAAVTFTLETDAKGDGQWRTLHTVEVPPNGYSWLDLSDDPAAAWIRVRTNRDCQDVTASFHFSNQDQRSTQTGDLFAGMAKHNATDYLAGLVRARGDNLRTLQLVSSVVKKGELAEEANFSADADLQLAPLRDAASLAWLKKNATPPTDVISSDAASLIFVDDDGTTWRLPRHIDVAESAAGPVRVDREVCTERDLFHCSNLFYELPAINAGGFAKIRPIAAHDLRIHDYCSYRGLLILTGVATDAAANDHLVRSADGNGAFWAGTVDDLWQLGKAVGRGGPWLNTQVSADQPSDPYLMNGFDKRTLTLSQQSDEPVAIRVEIDLTGEGDWAPYQTFSVKPGQSVTHEFPAALHAYWLRTVADRPATASAQLTYE